MRRTPRCLVPMLLALPAAAGAQAAAEPPIVGRWDLRVTRPDGSIAPSWLEVTRSGNRALVGRFVGDVGSARPIARIDFADGTMRFAIPPQWEEGQTDLTVEGTFASERMTGSLVTPSGERRTWTATRAPSLRRAAAPRWGTPVRLFNGRDLTGWKNQGGDSRWRVVDGVLTNTASGGNLVTTRTFDDFKLHVEFRVPARGNSGIYLRGRYEVQVEDSGDRSELLPLHVGGVYGFLEPNENASRKPGEWQTYDITLVGRRVTVVLNGRTIVADQIIPGITGGALDSEEGAPGPILLQGDHTAVEYRSIVLTPGR
ncbi:MAG: 3-keto-disaccharide hydrolase [Gemmatirosa sp.]